MNASLPQVDLVILTDTSPTMKTDAYAASQAAEAALANAQTRCPADVRVVWLGLEGRWRGTAFNQTLRTYLTEQCGVAAEALRSRPRGALPAAGAQEDAARAIEDVSSHFDWRAIAQRHLLYLGDEALDGGGDRPEASDIAAADRAIQAARSVQVQVHTHLGLSKSRHRDALAQEYARVATATGGLAFAASHTTPTDFVALLANIICHHPPSTHSPENTMAKKKTPQSTDTQPDAPATTDTASPSAGPKSYIPTTMTGLQDYAYWWRYARENAQPVEPNAKTFRRGRIWT